MKIPPTGVLAILVAAMGGGGGYVMSGNKDFSVEVGRPLPEVYQEFSGIRTFGSGLRDEGFDVPEITVTRPSDHELVFLSPSANPAQSSRIAFTFEPGANPATTRVTTAIDVPPVQMPSAGKNMYLSEDKVEASFREAIADLGKQITQGNDTAAPTNKLAKLLDAVSIASHPEVLARMEARVAKLKAAENRINKELRQSYSARVARYRYDESHGQNYRFGEPTDDRARLRSRIEREYSPYGSDY